MCERPVMQGTSVHMLHALHKHSTWCAPLLVQVWFQLGNSMMPGGHSRITREQLTPDAQLRDTIATWKAAAASSQ
jgi:hypothetical protein